MNFALLFLSGAVGCPVFMKRFFGARRMIRRLLRKHRVNLM
jgi:hypothetical protein